MPRPTREPLLVAAGCVLATAAVWAIAFQVPAGARVDGTALDGLARLRYAGAWPLASFAVALVDPLPFAAVTLALTLIALARHRPRQAMVVPVVAVAASVTTELLKPLAGDSRPAPTPRFAPVNDGWPSGHMTAAMTVALCLVLVAPPRLRPSAAVLGGAFAAMQGYGVIVLGWHYPSDVLGACTVAAGWLALSIAVLGALREEPRSAGLGAREVVWPAAVAALLAGALAAGAVLARPHRLADYVRDNTTVVAAAAALGLVAVGVVALTAAALTVAERGAPRSDRARPGLRRIGWMRS
jgi:membrane-associated phospholipid phosphatase